VCDFKRWKVLVLSCSSSPSLSISLRNEEKKNKQGTFQLDFRTQLKYAPNDVFG